MLIDPDDAPSSVGEVVVRPATPSPSRMGLGLIVLVVPWLFGVLLVSDAVLDALGLPPGERPVALRLTVIVLALGPGALLLAYPFLTRLRTFAWLYARPQPQARVTSDGIEITLAGLQPRWYAWERVAELRPTATWRGTVGHLIATDGSLLAVVPQGLFYPRDGGWSGRSHSLAERVVEVRPDRYALAGANWAGWPHAFALRTRAVAFDVAHAQRRQAHVTAGVFAVLIGLGVVVTVVWLTGTAR